MKQLLSTIAFLSLTVFLFGQKKTYLSFDPACMDRLEYRYAGQTSGMSVLSYNVHLSNDNLATLDIGAEGINTSSKMPSGTISCSAFQLSDALVERINDGVERLYVVRQSEKGYIVTPVGAVIKFTKVANTYDVLGSGYRFSLPLNTEEVHGSENLGTAGFGNFVFFHGTKNKYCTPIYNLSREPDKACTVKTDYAFMPGLGFVGERTGLTEAEKKQNALFLYKVNGSDVEQYINSLCPGAVKPAPVAPKPEVYSVQPVMDKELAVTIQAAKEAWVQKSAQASEPTTPQKVAAAKKIHCPEKMGEGWHIVQPGESILAIARTYGVKMQSIVAWNKIPNPNYIEICQQIWLMPPPKGAVIAAAPAPSKNWKPDGVKKGVKPTESMASVDGPTTDRQWNGTAPAPQPKPEVYVQLDASAPAQAAAVPIAPAKVAQAAPAAPVVYGNYYSGQKPAQAPVVTAPVIQAAAVQAAPAPQIYASVATVLPTTTAVANPTPTNVPRAFEIPSVTEVSQPEMATYAATAAPTPTIYSAPTTFAKSAEMAVAPRIPLVHVVQPGESLYAIANKYGYNVQRFALMNGIPENVVLRPGMELIANDCTCPNPAYQGAPAAPTEYGMGSTGTVFQETNVYQTSQASTNLTPKSQVTYYDTPSTTPKGVVVQQAIVAPTVYSYQPSGVLKTHVVQQGEDAYSISGFYKIPVEDLLIWNNLSLNEQLFAGKTLVVGR